MQLDGVDERTRGGADGAALLNETIERRGEPASAESIEPGGLGVTIERPSIFQVEVLGDQSGLAPGEIVEFDFVALGVIANDAFAAVMDESDATRRIFFGTLRRKGLSHGGSERIFFGEFLLLGACEVGKSFWREVHGWILLKNLSAARRRKFGRGEKPAARQWRARPPIERSGD